MKTETQRDERLSLADQRNMNYEAFRNNIRLLRHYRCISAVEMAELLPPSPAISGKRIIDLEYGRSNPTTDEILNLTKFFNVSLTDLMQREARVSFVDEINSIAYVVMKPEIYKGAV